MELAKVTTKGQITIPKAIRELLDLKEGSKIIFIQKGKDVIIKNSSMLALEKIQDAFEGEAERLGLKTEEDVVKMIKKSRKERKKEGLE
ncbi:MAG: AbrB/MazE/SpoVT family DNA-binding domain-containing protein [Clostridium sp.]|nr:AbrB/MazE/SpoVT family DNA-binding domain-containing protein [Clostridium sp.]